MDQWLTQHVEDLLSHLEAESADPTGNPNIPLYYVPSKVTVSELCTQDLPQEELQRAISVSFEHKTQVINTTICLLSLFTTPSPSRPGVASDPDFWTSDNSWTLNTLTRFWEAVAPKGAQFDFVGSNSPNVVSFLDHIRVYFAHILDLSPLSAVMNRTSVLFSQIITTFLVGQPLPLPSSVEKRLCLMSMDLALVGSKSEPRYQSFAWDSLSTLLEVRRDRKRFHAFGQDLQVRASRWIS